MTSPTPENLESLACVTGGAQEPVDDAASLQPIESGAAPGRTGRSWKEFALVIGAGVVAMAGAVVVTLAATHKSAVRHNFQAYVNGVNDGFAAGAYANGLNDGYAAGAHFNGFNDGYDAYLDAV